MNRLQGWMGVAALCAFSVQSGAFAHVDSKRVCDFMPKNDLHLFDNVKRIATIDEADFNARIDQVEKIYAPIFAAHGAKLVVERKWTDPTVNAYADQRGTNWTVSMFGGLARRAEVTGDGFSLVICHEVGHHLGGYPFYSSDWAATEGQSDYFATQACAKMLWSDQKEENAKFRGAVPELVAQKCDAAYANPDEQNLCYRSAMGGKSLASLLAALGRTGEPKFETPDPKVVTRTNSAHPAGQCRLDTYFQGGLCTKAFDQAVIPGKSGSTGSNNADAENEADKFACGGKAGSADGVRPACWFKSVVHN